MLLLSKASLKESVPVNDEVLPLVLQANDGTKHDSMVQVRKALRRTMKLLTTPLNTPLRFTIVSFVLSEIITISLTWILAGSFVIQAFLIAGVCSTILPYFVSKRLIDQQRTIEQRNEQLQQLAEELRIANVELNERNAQLDSFSHTVAHDLQTPLSAISGLSRLLEENYNRLTNDTLREHLRMIGHTTEKMGYIVDELLLLSQMDDNSQVPLEALDMRSIVYEVVDYFSLMLDESRGEIILPPRWPMAIGYAPWVEQVWLNYISNALKYGGRPPVIRLGATIQKESVRFWVQDNGQGISEEDKSRLFIPFTRLDDARARGHGLGLSIVQNIVERLGGSVGVEDIGPNEPGSRFYFTLPSAQQRVAANGSPISQGASASVTRPAQNRVADPVQP